MFLLSNAASYAIKILSALPSFSWSCLVPSPLSFELCLMKFLIGPRDGCTGSFLYGTFDNLILLIDVSFQLGFVLVLTSSSYLNHEIFVMVIGSSLSFEVWTVFHLPWG